MALKHLKSADREFKDVLKQLTASHRIAEVWSDFIAIFAYSISNAVDKSHFEIREKLYFDTIKKYKKSELELFPILMCKTVFELDKNPEQDFLGEIHMELGLGSKSLGQDFTPYDVCELMAAMAVKDIPGMIQQQGYITLNDPTCGSGAILISTLHKVKNQLFQLNLNYQNHILIEAQDIDFTAAMMCYIQLSLLGVAGYIKVGNTITEPISLSDTLENYWFTPMYFSEIWHTRRLINKALNLFQEPNLEISIDSKED